MTNRTYSLQEVITYAISYGVLDIARNNFKSNVTNPDAQLRQDSAEMLRLALANFESRTTEEFMLLQELR